MSRQAVLGFDRKLDLEWLEMAAGKAADGAEPSEIKHYLLQQLQTLSYDNQASGSARAKTVRVILRIWRGVDPALRPIHERALDLLPTVAAEERFALHWAMTCAAYPFFSDHAAVIGNLLTLHDQVTTNQITRRISDHWGDRSTVFRTSRHVVRTMVAWGAIRDSGKGTYARGLQPVAISEAVGRILLEALLLDAEQDALPVKQAGKHPALFPFDFEVDVSMLRGAKQFRVFRQGLDADFVALAESGTG
jgi:hypothetical protein